MIYKCIGERLRKQRFIRGLTQEHVAEIAEVSLSFYGHIERGTRKMSLDTFFRLVEALGCSADELLGTTGEKEKRNSAIELLAMAEQMAAMLDAGMKEDQ